MPRRPARRRRTLVAAIAGAAVAGAAWVLSACSSGAMAVEAGPNVLVIVTDDQRSPGELRAMPQTRRWIFRDGTRFPDAFATTPLCCPSRASILTGRYAHNTGQHLNTGPTQLDASTTIEHYLQDRGYETGIVGKYLNTWPIGETAPYFDDSRTTLGGYYNTVWNLNGTQRTVKRYETGFVDDQARGFINRAESSDSQPWFLYVAPSAPHAAGLEKPATPAPRYADAPVGRFPETPASRERSLADKPPFLRDLVRRFPPGPRQAQRIRAGSLRSLMSVDDMVGAIHRELRRDGELRNTLVIFLSDNGDLWGDHGGLTIKDLPYFGASRIPLAMTWPGHLTPGTVDRRLVANVDVAPTIAAAVGGISPQPAMDGHSLLDHAWRRDRMHLEYFGLPQRIPPWAATITRTAAYTQYGSLGTEPPFRELYDLRRDPFENDNVLGDSRAGNDPAPARILALAAQLGADNRCSGPTCP